MAKLLFTHSYFYRFDPKQWETAQPYPPYGTIYAAALMRQDGHNVSLYDTNLKEDIQDVVPLLQEQQPDYFIIYDDGFNYLTKMCLTRMREAAFDMIAYAKDLGCRIIVSSSDSTDHYGMYLEKGADYILLGEGELTLQELVTQLEAGNTDVSQLLGIAWTNQDGTIVRNARRSVIKSLDDLPSPAWDLINIEDYRKIWVEKHGYFGLNIATTRGCPYKCNWCAKPIYGNRYNSRSPQRVVDEVEMLTKTYGAEYFWVCDDIFGLKPGWVQEFRDLLAEKKLSIQYKIQSRADLLLKEDTIEALAASGLDTVWIGAESGSQKILDAMDKGTKIEQIYEATKLLKRKGVKVAFFLQFGYLGETMEDIEKTIQMVLDLMPDDIGISVSYPLPGTKFFEVVQSQLKDKQNWEDSDDLAMMYKATFSPDFYRRLHRLVHKRFQKKRGWQTIKKILTSPSQLNKKTLKTALATFYYIPAAAMDKMKLNALKAKG
ncbi:MAG: radical SAM protein [Aureispira sp.]|nr:radical SAM protein [Aureispira sp.]